MFRKKKLVFTAFIVRGIKSRVKKGGKTKNNLKKLFLAIILPVFILSSLPAESSYDYQTEFRKTYEVKPGTRITVSSRNGTTNIEVWDKKEVEVFAIIGSNKSMKELVKVSVEVTIDDKEMEIATAYSGKKEEKEDGDFGICNFLKWILKGEYSGGKVNVNYEIKVPEHVVISEVNTNGKIIIENVDGFVTASTTNGSIETEFKGIREGGTKLSTTNGDITIRLPQSLKCILELKTVNGGIDVGDVGMEIISKDKNKYLRGKIGKGGEKISASTTNGGIKIRRL